jgi:hypothetical protein
MTDNLINLPTDNEPLGKNEHFLMNAMANTNKSTFHQVISEFKEPLVIGILFFIFSLPQISQIFLEFIPYTQKSELSLHVVKSIAFICVIFIFKNSSFIFK